VTVAGLDLVVALVLALAPCALIIGWYLAKLRRAPEPWPRVVAICLAGALTFFLAALAQREIGAYVPRERVWLWSFAVVALTEELLKLAAILVVAPWPTRYVRLSSGIVFGVSAGVGFAAAENVAYVTGHGMTVALLRAVTAVPSHALHTTLVGLALGTIHRAANPVAGWRITAVALAAAVSLHGLYDALLLQGGLLRGAVVILLLVEGWVVLALFRRAMRRDIQRDIDLLRQVPLLADAPGAAVRLLADSGVRRLVAPGRLVVRRGGAGDAMFIVLRGEVEIRREDVTVNRLPAGGFFGEVALVTGAPRNADVATTVESLLIRVPALALFAAIDSVDGLADTLVTAGRSRAYGEVKMPSAEDLRVNAGLIAGLGRDEAPTDDVAKRLGAMSLMQGLAAKELEALAEASVISRQAPSTALLKRGSSGFGLCLLLSGEAEVRVRGKTVARFVDGDFFGEVSLLTGWRAGANVRAVSPVELAVVRWSGLDAVVARNPMVGWRLLLALAARFTADTEVDKEESAADTLLSVASSKLRGFVGWRGRGATDIARRFRKEVAELRTLPLSTADTLAAVVQRSEPPTSASTGIHFATGPDEWWSVSKAGALDGVARCPDLIRFVARMVVGRRPIVIADTE